MSYPFCDLLRFFAAISSVAATAREAKYSPLAFPIPRGILSTVWRSGALFFEIGISG
jgi:hypothetical protein